MSEFQSCILGPVQGTALVFTGFFIQRYGWSWCAEGAGIGDGMGVVCSVFFVASETVYSCIFCYLGM